MARCMLFSLFLSIWMGLFLPGPSTQGSDQAPPFRIGAGMHDTTGPPVGVMFAGMVNFDQTGEGIFLRTRSRAFVIQDRATEKRVVLAVVEQGMMSQDLHLAVVDRLKSKFGDIYTEQNVLICATHTHSAPGGYFGHWGLNLAIGSGFCEETFENIVDGIAKSIEDAHERLTPGYITMGYGVGDPRVGKRFSCSRSPEAYLGNPLEERDKYKNELGEHENVNRTITVLKFVTDEGEEIGMFVWVAAHPHVGGHNDKLIHGDTIGYAAYLLEKDHDVDYRDASPFVAAVAMNDAGDSMGWLPEDEPEKLERKRSLTSVDRPSMRFDYRFVKRRGEAIHRETRAIYDEAERPLKGPVEGRIMYGRLTGFKIDPDYIAPEEVRYEGMAPVNEDRNNICVCKPVIGLGVGMWGGRGRDVANEGHRFERLSELPEEAVKEDRLCHLEKFNFLHVGRNGGIFSSFHPFMAGTGRLLPDQPPVVEDVSVQILRIGDFAALGLPYEITTMSGRRLRDRIKRVMTDLEYVEINAVSNGYMCYVTTRDEYAVQCYEGGQNWFGPYTLNALTQMFCDLGNTMTTDAPLPDYALSRDEIVITMSAVRERQRRVGRVSHDLLPSGRRFGEVIQEPSAAYAAGDSVVARFIGGHPNNSFQDQISYLAVEREDDSEWKAVAWDWDPSTYIHWETEGRHGFRVTTEWIVPEDAAAGRYRIRHMGCWKEKDSGKITPYEGISRAFAVQ